MALPKSVVEGRTVTRTVHKDIKIKKQQIDHARQIEKEFKLSAVASRVLAARGFSADDKLKHFISPTLKEGLPEPNKLKGLGKACKLIAEVVAQGGKIAICCDFDVDGLSGGAQVQDFLSVAGVKSKVFVPDRFEEGYGLNEGMIERIAKEGYALVITIDYGTTNVKELTLAHSLGLKTVVVDHHHVSGANPPCDVFINPNQKGCGFADKTLCAAGLAWYLLMGLRQAIPSASGIDIRNYLDLACLGTICDMVPLIGANRVIAKKGLETLGRSIRPGVVALRRVVGIKSCEVSCGEISFGIGPRLNAAGRMVHGETVIDLLTTKDQSNADRIAKELNDFNLQRQEVEARVKELAIRDIEERGEIPKALVVWDPDFHTGVIGIVAQRLVEIYYRPAVVMGADKEGIFKGSVRGVKGFSVVEALAAVSEHLVKYGGHEGAGGLSIEEGRLQDFAEAFTRECESRLDGLPTSPSAEADTEASIGEISVDLVNELRGFSPFGVGNPGPLLLLKNVVVADLRVLKGNHTKVLFKDGDRFLHGMLWRQSEHPALIKGRNVDVVCRPDLNNFQGVISLQATIEAIRAA